MNKKINIYAEIHGIIYKPYLCRKLTRYEISDFEKALSKDSAFILKIDDNQEFAVSWWVSPKRTRSYPYARVYDTLSFSGKKVTIIPLVKDEGLDGDRDFLQWDTISLMSLLGIYVIIGYYKEASKNPNYKNKITNQRFDIEYLVNELYQLSKYQSDALHWNLNQTEKIGEISQRCLYFYEKLSKRLGVKIHSKSHLINRLNSIMQSRENFIQLSRNLAKLAQERESSTFQPKEYVDGSKSTITIKNYLGGLYHFTCDEVAFYESKIFLIECKHSKRGLLPALEDIKDGLLKMAIFSNLKNVKIDNSSYEAQPVLKLTNNSNLFFKQILYKVDSLNFRNLIKESMDNNFLLMINSNIVSNNVFE